MVAGLMDACTPSITSSSDREVLRSVKYDGESGERDLTKLEPIRKSLLSLDPRAFELFIRDSLIHSGFSSVEVTRYSQDGGIDINARPAGSAWAIKNLLVQIQAKRWLHTVGRREVAELRGSLQPHAAGCIVTTSHFSRAALTESNEAGKVPITVVDGYELAELTSAAGLLLPSSLRGPSAGRSRREPCARTGRGQRPRDPPRA